MISHVGHILRRIHVHRVLGRALLSAVDACYARPQSGQGVNGLEGGREGGRGREREKASLINLGYKV